MFCVAKERLQSQSRVLRPALLFYLATEESRPSMEAVGEVADGDGKPGKTLSKLGSAGMSGVDKS